MLFSRCITRDNSWKSSG